MSSTNPESLARLLRLRAGTEPLRIEVAGSSMGRTIVSGAAVWVTAAARPRWGEIWAFCDPDGNVEVHRCVGARSGSSRFWGDANPNADALVHDEVLVGKVIAMQPPGGLYRPTRRFEELLRASLVGVRRVPRRLWYSRHDLARRVVPGSRRRDGS